MPRQYVKLTLAVMRRFAFGKLLAASQARERACRVRLVAALAAAGLEPPVPPRRGSAGEFALDEATRSVRGAAARRALDALAAARRQAAPFEALERRHLAERARRVRRSEAAEADEANRMLPTARP